MQNKEVSLTDRIETLAAQVAAARVRSARLWGGAGVVLSTTPPAPTKPSFYPDPRYVVTPHAREVSWLLVKLRDAFYSHPLMLDKEELFGRLADAADRYTNEANASKSVEGILTAVLAEARVLATERSRHAEHFGGEPPAEGGPG